MSLGTDAYRGSTLLNSLHGILNLKETALGRPGGHIIVVKVTELRK